MRIAHLCLACFYFEDYGYQENLLPKYQKKAGHDVYIIAPAQLQIDGVKAYIGNDYVNSNGIPVKIIRFAKWKSAQRFKKYEMLFSALEEIQPDIIFVHGGQSLSLKDVIKYKKKNDNVRVLIDNHADYFNSPVNSWKGKVNARWGVGYYMSHSAKYVDQYFGVTPWRCTFLSDVYHLPKDKISLLVMGGDDDQIHFERKQEIREQICQKYQIDSDNTFIVCTGGKISREKNIHLLIDAVAKLSTDNVVMLVFGNISESFKEEFQSHLGSEKIRMIGWVDAKDVYDYFLASDLVAFPGTHSVLWEQAVACKIPCIFRDWSGMHHVDIGGNCEFLKDVTVDNLAELLHKIIRNPNIYKRMKANAEKDAADDFLYSSIARKALEIMPQNPSNN